VPLCSDAPAGTRGYYAHVERHSTLNAFIGAAIAIVDLSGPVVRQVAPRSDGNDFVARHQDAIAIELSGTCRRKTEDGVCRRPADVLPAHRREEEFEVAESCRDHAAGREAISYAEMSLLLGSCPLTVTGRGQSWKWPGRVPVVRAILYVVPEQPNPYTPGAGDRPRALVGRDVQLALAETVRTQLEARYAANCLVLIGLRGVGKTVLLKEIRDRFTVKSWLAIYVQIRPSVDIDRAFADVALRSGTLLPAKSKLLRSLKKLSQRGGSLQVLGAGVGVGAGTASRGGYEDFRDVLHTLGLAAQADGVGVALIVDELQAMSIAALGALMNMVFELRDDIPLAFIGGGLTYLPSKISKATTSTERLRYEPTEFLFKPDAQRAVVEPALAERVTWDDDALTHVIELAEGYPYFLQLYASETWEAARAIGFVTHITLENVKTAQPQVARQLDNGLYGSRFDKLGPKQREYVFAMEQLLSKKGRAVRSGDVARLMKKNLTEVSPVRDGLIRSGTVHSPAYGDLEFSVPGFAQYLARRRIADAQPDPRVDL
jgi:hypothetical protein